MTGPSTQPLRPGALVTPHQDTLVADVKKRYVISEPWYVRRAGYPIALTERMGIATYSHMCGTAVTGTNPSHGLFDPNRRSHDVGNLYIVDGNFFPYSAAWNPALTIAANALRVASAIAGSTR